MYKNVLLMKNGCEGCSADTCIGVSIAQSLDAKVTAVYVTGNFTWRELRKIYGLDELKWPGAARAGKAAQTTAESRKTALANEALQAAETMCASRGIPCETVRLSGKSPFHAALKLAKEKDCDVIVSCAQPQAAISILSQAKPGRSNARVGIPVLIHHGV